MVWAIVIAAIALAAYVFVMNERANARIQQTEMEIVRTLLEMEK